MPAMRYNTTGPWFKGNTHIHTTASDGGTAAGDLARMYAGQGYRFLFRTDHWVVSRHDDETASAPLLWLHGVELDGFDHGGSPYHVVCLGSLHGLSREMGFVAAMELARAQGGLLILAHPFWSGNSIEDALRWGFHGVETYNHVCRWLNGKSNGFVYWTNMLARDKDTLSLAVDDAHVRPEHPGWNGGWIMVNAPDCTPPALMAGIRAGEYYSSCGPDFLSIQSDATHVRIRTSPVQFIRLVGPGWLGRRYGSFDRAVLTEAEFEIPADWPYAYLEIEDQAGRLAWTNCLFRSEP